MTKLHYRLLNGGYYALLIDGEEIGTVYKSEHAQLIEIAVNSVPELEQQIETLKEDYSNTERQRDELAYRNDQLEHELHQRDNTATQ